ncbi:hypothetical protein Cgig2_004631 [Carnegiea gigantea]|uniref:DUF4283 domain-containing protein n=1 Tax=Carnegiea gigantea TaxID=171969 RepID=A0A9Q1JZ15_9CARY|nr:hypothetical protein Cgig2_004631 [Carnegiea gigantea]
MQIQPESSSTPERPVSREGGIIEGEDNPTKAVSTAQGNGTVTIPPLSSMTTPKRGTVSSYASLVNLDKGTSLQFVDASTINRMKYAKIKTEDIAAEIEYWQSIILCSGFFRRIWKTLVIDKIYPVKRGVFLVRFTNLDDQLSVVQKRVYYFDHKPLLVKAWNPELDLNAEAITSPPIWVRLMDLDIKYWGMASLSKLGSTLGIPIKTDKYTMDKTRLNYAKLLIDIPIKGEFPSFIDLINDQDVVVRVQLEYKWKPIKCQHCRMYGYNEEDCRKKISTR